MWPAGDRTQDLRIKRPLSRLKKRRKGPGPTKPCIARTQSIRRPAPNWSPRIHEGILEIGRLVASVRDCSVRSLADEGQQPMPAAGVESRLKVQATEARSRSLGRGSGRQPVSSKGEEYPEFASS